MTTPQDDPITAFERADDAAMNAPLRPSRTRPPRLRPPRPRSTAGLGPQPKRRKPKRRFLHSERVRRMISLAIVIAIAVAGLAQTHAETELMVLIGKISVEWMVGSTAMVVIEGIIHIVTGGE